jgi:hypothetical protein
MTAKTSQSGGDTLQGALPPLSGSKIPPVPWGGIPPSIAALVMRCKALLSLSIQHKGGGLRWPLYCCTSAPPPELTAQQHCGARAAQSQLPPRPHCNLFLPLPNMLPPCLCCNLFLPPSNNDLLLPNASATAAPPPSSDAAMSLLFKSSTAAAIFCYCRTLRLSLLFPVLGKTTS